MFFPLQLWGILGFFTQCVAKSFNIRSDRLTRCFYALIKIDIVWISSVFDSLLFFRNSTSKDFSQTIRGGVSGFLHEV